MRKLLFVFVFAGAFLAARVVCGQSAVTPAAAVPDEKTISMDFDGASLKEVLKIFSQLSGLNFVANEDVEAKKITVFFDNVPVQDALESLIRANNLHYEQKPGSKIFVVTLASTSVTLVTKVFRLKYARLSISPLEVGGQSTIKDLESSEGLGSSEESEDSSSSSSSGSTSSPPSSSQSSSGGAGTKNLVAERGIDKMVSALLSPAGKVTADVFTNTLVVTDTPERIKEVEAVLEEIDVPPPQVMIEVYVVEVKRSVLIDHGLDWGGTNGALGTFTGGSRTTGFPFTESFLNQQNQGLKAVQVGTTAAGTTTTQSTLVLGTMSLTNFTTTLRLITSDTSTKILARPRVLTLNNEAATIKLITNTSIAKITSTTASEGTSTTATNTAERAEVGISLKMTPQVNQDDSVGLFLEPSVSTVAASSFFPSDFLDPTTRSIKTMARVKNGETLVLGGLVDKNKSLTAKKIPVLGDLPFFGYAFRYDDGDDTDRELLIFITPHIVKSYDSLTEESATSPAGGRDLSIQRLLGGDFKDQEMDRTLAPLSEAETEKIPAYREERRLIRDRVKKTLNPDADREMSDVLDAFDPYQSNARWGRG